MMGRDAMAAGTETASPAAVPLLAFVHIEKAAGTTLLYILRRSFLFRYLDVRPLRRREEGVFTSEDWRCIRRLNPYLRCVGGHAVRPFSDLEAAAPGVRYITVLRAPIERYLSQYLYWNRVLGKGWSFERFLDHEPSHDFQTRKIAGSVNLEAAKDLLRRKLFLVGVVEHFDEFVICLEQRLRPSTFDPFYRRRNAAIEPDARAQELLQRYGDRMEEVNRLDTQLYAFVTEELLPRQREDYGPGLEKDLAAFQHGAGRGARLDPRLAVDAVCRKLYYEPVTGLLRASNGLPMKGSY